MSELNQFHMAQTILAEHMCRAGPSYHLVFMFYFRENLELMRELNERSAQGRACGNLGNTYYLLGNFQQAIHYHEEVSCVGWGNILSKIES